ncbi:hypothetical protein PG995_014488 [Apiospora arundinis]
MHNPPGDNSPDQSGLAFVTAAPAWTANRGLWSPVEDERLKAAVAQHGARWTTVAADVGTRNGEQCSKRWNDYLNPVLDHGPWSTDEDNTLLDLVISHGHNWKLIADTCHKSRSALSIKNRYGLLARRQRRHINKGQPAWSTMVQRGCPPSVPSLTQGRYFMESIDTTLHAAQSHTNPVNHISDHAQRPPPTSALTPASEGLIVRPDSNTPVQQLNQASLHITDGHGDIAIPSRHHDEIAQHDEETRQFMSCLDWLGLNATVDNLEEATESLGDMMATPERSSRSGRAQISRATEGESSNRTSPGVGVEFSVTCTRAKLKAMVCHAFEGAMLEAAGLSDESEMTVTLRLRR